MQTEDRRRIETGEDPLLSKIELPLRSTLYPLGFPVLAETNSLEVMESLRESWGLFEKAFDTSPLHLSVAVSGEDHDEALPPPVFRCRRHILSVTANRANQAVCDMSAGFACAWITSSTAKNRLYLRDAFTDALVYTMLHGLHLSAVHAACVAWNGCGLLLCGPSGAGKTSLAVACAMRGWTLICDDASYLVRGFGGPTVIGNPYELRFKRDAAKLFPLLSQHEWVQRTNGKPTVFARPADFPGIRTDVRADVECLVFLNRKEGAEARLAPVRDDIQERLKLPRYGDEWMIAEQEECLRSLSPLNAFELTYSDFDSATDCLRRLAERGGAL
ncbi:HPr kinase/phosphorylase [Paludibaculum fermentans]|uniref:HPr kinase/phosphorylase n=1 Tax=Paludibaculum fermentans TaxID=1473598 RepID=UPI003EB7F921